MGAYNRLGQLITVFLIVIFPEQLCATASPIQPQEVAANESVSVFFDHSQLSFLYQDLNDPWPSYSCKHEKANVSLFLWHVYCLVGQNLHHYAVHLVVSLYPRTTHGVSAYEVLYWITDRTDPGSRTFDSSTVWIHNSQEGNRVRVFELSQGIENDMAALRLAIDLTAD